MTDKYTLQNISPEEGDDSLYYLYNQDIVIAWISCSEDTANLLDKCLNQTSRAGSKTSQAKRDAAKRNIAKRWGKK